MTEQDREKPQAGQIGIIEDGAYSIHHSIVRVVKAAEKMPTFEVYRRAYLSRPHGEWDRPARRSFVAWIPLSDDADLDDIAEKLSQYSTEAFAAKRRLDGEHRDAARNLGKSPVDIEALNND